MSAALFLSLAVSAAVADNFIPQPARGWRYRVVATDLPSVDNLAYGGDGHLYATLELGEKKGRVVRVRNGTAETVLAGLDRPDGLAARGRKLYVTEEIAEGRVLESSLDGNELKTLTTLHNPEGIAVLANGDLVLSEDKVNGRLVQWRKQSGAVETLIGGLNRPEGLALAGDGAIIVAETGTGRVLSWKDGRLRSVVDDLDEPDQVKLSPDGALWITEDAPHGRLLRLRDGALETIVSDLNAPQGMAFAADGGLFVAEQGRARILYVWQEEKEP
jgi:sugar lactone lactonase YvrE